LGFLIVRRLPPLMRVVAALRPGQAMLRSMAFDAARMYCSHPGGLARTNVCSHYGLCESIGVAGVDDVLFTAWLGQPGSVDVGQIASSVGALLASASG
jgi:hypothetical protein